MTYTGRDWELVLSASDPEQWIKDLTEKWFTTYIASLERMTGKQPHYWPTIRSMVTANETVKWEEDQLPCLIVVNSGLVGEPVRNGDGQWDAAFGIATAIVCAGVSRNATFENAKAYAAAFRSMMLQHSDLEQPGRCGGSVWKDERYTDVRSQDTRTIMAATAVWEVEVCGVAFDLDIPGGEPPVDPYAIPGVAPVIESGSNEIIPVRRIS